jgi:putative GTP pyrophosphokinase
MFLKAKLLHALRSADAKYYEIRRPKPDGYRGIHDIYEYNARSHPGNAHTDGLEFRGRFNVTTRTNS